MVNKELNAPVNKEIVTFEEHVRSSDIHKGSNPCTKFDYQLNDKATKSKLLKAAKRVPLEIEEYSTSSTLSFCAGSWFHDVLPSAEYWKEVKGDKTCKIGDYEIKIGGIKPGKEINGKTVNTQVVFFADRDKVVCHLYNTTQKILVNGHGYKKFIDLFLKPYFMSKTEEDAEDINLFNQEVIEKLGPKKVKRSDIKYKKGTAFPCNSCDFATKSISTLKKHKSTEHAQSFNSSKKLMEPRQSTRNNSIIERLMIEDVSVSDLTTDGVNLLEENSLKYTCYECNFVTTSKNLIDDHVKSTHVPEENEEVRFICINCEHEFGEVEDYDTHVKTHEVVNIPKANPNIDKEFSELVSVVYSHILDHHIQALKAQSDNEEVEWETTEKVKCEQCDYTSAMYSDLKVHMQTMHKTVKVNLTPQITLTCTMCPYKCNLNKLG